MNYKTFENKVIDLFHENGKLVSNIIVSPCKTNDSFKYTIIFKQVKVK